MSLMSRGIISSGKLGGIAPPISDFAANTALLNGSSRWFDAGLPTELQITGNMTFSIWAKPSVLAGTLGSRVRFRTSQNERCWGLESRGDGVFRAVISSNGTSNTSVDSTTGPVLGVWNNILFSYDGTDFKIYIDGTLEGTSAHAGGFFASAANVMIGVLSDNPEEQSYDGTLAFPRIWNRDLSAAEITENFNTTKPKCFSILSAGLKNGLVYAPRLCNFDGNSGDELVDQSPSGITTSNVGSPPFTGSGLTVQCT